MVNEEEAISIGKEVQKVVLDAVMPDLKGLQIKIAFLEAEEFVDAIVNTVLNNKKPTE